jgi:hypothetical protein
MSFGRVSTGDTAGDKAGDKAGDMAIEVNR